MDHEDVTLTPLSEGWALSAHLYLPDRPGSLAELARMIARHDGNITRFSFNRAESPNRVGLRADVPRATVAGSLLEHLKHGELLSARDESADGPLPDPDALLTVKVRLADRPGTLASFAELLARREANVIFMQYDHDLAVGQAEMSMAAPSAEEAAALLAEMTDLGYDYHVEYRGSDPEAYHGIIGLSAAEVFFLRLRETLPESQRGELRRLVESSDQLQHDLLGFRKESARSEESLAASEVFENILELAAMSLRKLGSHFSLRAVGPIQVGERCRLHALTPPTGGSHFILDDGDELTLIDTGYGLYYRDWCEWMGRMGLAPERIRRVMLTHGDADHAGFAGALQEGFGVTVFADAAVERVFAEGNRAAGAETELSALNAHFTGLVNAFARVRYPAEIESLEGAGGEQGGFEIAGRFAVGDVSFVGLQSLGGHTPGQLFYLAPEAGLLFSGDYVIDFASLSDTDRGRLSVPKYLMMSTNADSRTFMREMQMLQQLMLGIEADLAPRGLHARIFPGHGEPYFVDEAVTTGAWEVE